MNKSLYTPVLLSIVTGTASAAVLSQGDGTLKVDGTKYTYLYTVTDGTASNLTNANSWQYLIKDKTSGDMEGPKTNFFPTGAEDVLIGYDYNATTGVFTPVDTARKFNISTTADNLYLAGPITFTGGDVTQDIAYHMAEGTVVTITGAIGLKGANTTWDYGTLTSSSTLPVVRQTNGACWGANNYAFAGVLTMEEEVLEREIYYGGFIDGSRNYVNNFTLYDMNGDVMTNRGIVSGLGALAIGEYGITHSGNSFKLVAKAAPEPATATLSLMALSGLCARRRRK